MSQRSFTATISISAPISAWARKKLRPIRPKPLIPTRVAIRIPFLRFSVFKLGSECSGGRLISVDQSGFRTLRRSGRAFRRDPADGAGARAASASGYRLALRAPRPSAEDRATVAGRPRAVPERGAPAVPRAEGGGWPEVEPAQPDL